MGLGKIKTSINGWRKRWELVLRWEEPVKVLAEFLEQIRTSSKNVENVGKTCSRVQTKLAVRVLGKNWN